MNAFLTAMRLAAISIFIMLGLLPAHAQTDWDVRPYYQRVGLTANQIDGVMHRGEALALSLPTRNENEIFLFGTIYINATPDDYLRYYSEYSHSREPQVIATKTFNSPPQLSDLKGFNLDPQDVETLKRCNPSNCPVLLPEGVIENMHKRVDWSAPDRNQKVNQFMQQSVLQHLENYARAGGKALGMTHDGSGQSVSIQQQFDYLLSYKKPLPANPAFYSYLLSYPEGRPQGADTWYYWDNVNFGFKPTLRLVQVFTMKGVNPGEPALSIAGKQLYATHYFETAVRFTFLFASSGGPNKPGMYLVEVMGSELSGLSGFSGDIIRRVAKDKSVADLQTALGEIKKTLERK